MAGSTRQRNVRARERSLRVRREAQRQERRRQLRQRIVMVAATAVIVGAVTVAVVIGRAAKDRPGPITLGQPTAGATTMPPWSTPADTPARATVAGLTLGPMGTADHYHAHLDIRVSGRAVPVAADIGVDPRSGQMTALHTHDTSGVIHIEAARKNQRFTLGQLFTEWNVKLTSTQIGGLTNSGANVWVLYINGKPHAGDPAAVVVHKHDEIALTFGPAGDKQGVPSSYDFKGI